MNNDVEWGVFIRIFYTDSIVENMPYSYSTLDRYQHYDLISFAQIINCKIIIINWK